MRKEVDRRGFIAVAGAGYLAFCRSVGGQFGPERPGEGKLGNPAIKGFSSYGRGLYYFDPAGLFVEPGTTVQWLGIGRRSMAAFHPSNNNHELRIPERAEPFNSAKAATPGGGVEWKFEVEGTYDYYCELQESLGMVGRIIVGKPGGPGEKPPGYGNREGRSVMYPDAERLLAYLKSEEIVRKRSIPYPVQLFERKFPTLR